MRKLMQSPFEREEANKCLKSLMRVLIIKDGDKYRPAKDTSRQDAYRALYEIQEALGTRRIEREEALLENMQDLELTLSALRTPTREQVEKVWRGEWRLFDDCANEGLYCSQCGKKVYRVEYANVKMATRFCPNCMSAMTDEAVEIVMERWKEAVDGETD